MLNPKSSNWIFGTALTLSCLVFAVACGNAKSRGERTVLGELKTPAAADKSTAAGGAAAAAGTAPDEIETAFKAFSGPEGLSLKEMQGLVKRYGSGQIDPEMLGMLYDDKPAAAPGGAPAKDQRLTLEQFKSRVPTLSWARAGHPLAATELDAKLLELYPTANKTARDRLAELILRYDEKLAGGNADKLLSQNELLVPGAILGLVSREDFSQGLPKRFGLQFLQTEMVNHKVEQLLLGRYPITSLAQLESADQKLEWAQTLMRRQLVERQLKTPQGSELAFADLKAFLARWNIPTGDADENDRWTRLSHLYDQKILFGGDGNGKLNALEATSLLMDALYGQTVQGLFEGNPTAATATRSPEHLTALEGAYPKIGPVLFLEEGGKPSEKFWNSFGGDHTTLVDSVMTMMSVDMCEKAFEGFDENNDNLLQKSEATDALAALGIKDPKTIDDMYGSSDSIKPGKLQSKLMGILMTHPF